MSYVQYVTISSTGGTNSSPWLLVNREVTPINIGLQVVSSGGNYQIDVTLDDITRTYPNPTRPSTTPYTTFLSSLCAGGGIAAGTANALGTITQPIAAFRLTSTSTTAGGNITLTSIQAGIC